jgi:hypothetical protein
MRHDFASLVQLVWPPPNGVGGLALSSSSGAAVIAGTAEQRAVTLPAGITQLLITALRQAADGHAVLLFSAGRVLGLAEVASAMATEVWKVRMWLQEGMLEDYAVGDEHHVPIASIRHFQHQQELAMTSGLDLDDGPVLGWDDETCQRAWTTAVQVLEPEPSDGRLTARLAAEVPVSLRDGEGGELGLGVQLSQLVVRAVRETAEGKTLVLAIVDDLMDPLSAAREIAHTVGSIPKLVSDGLLDDYFFAGEHHIPSASVEAFYRHRRAIEDRALASLKAKGMAWRDDDPN